MGLNIKACVCNHNTLIGTDGIDRDLWTSDVTSLLIDKSCMPMHEERDREKERMNALITPSQKMSNHH